MTIETVARPREAIAERTPGVLWLEVSAVLALGVFPDLWFVASGWLWPDPAEQPFAYLYWSLIVRSLQVSLPVLWIIARCGEPWQTFGVVFPRWRDAGYTILAVLAAEIADALYWGVVYRAVPAETLARDNEMWSTMFPPAETAAYVALVVTASLANGFAEELVMRGYLIPRLERLLGSAWSSIGLTAILFAAYHLYQGWLGAGGALIMGIVFGAMFWKVRRLWPFALAHALIDIKILT
jgi:membrane protease YdiL (CAAX protease family)